MVMATLKDANRSPGCSSAAIVGDIVLRAIRYACAVETGAIARTARSASNRFRTVASSLGEAAWAHRLADGCEGHMNTTAS